MLAALAVAVMSLGTILPIATYVCPMFCALLLQVVLKACGSRIAWAWYGAVALLSVLLAPDKEAAAVFVFLGYYPIVKWDIDRLKQKPVRVLLKLLVFNVSIVAMYMILGFLLHMDAVVEDFTQMGVALLIAFIALMNVCMFMYDRLLSPLVILYVKRLRPKLKFLRS